VSFTYIRVLSIAVLKLIFSMLLWFVEMTLTRGRLLSKDPRYLMATRAVVPRVILLTYRRVFSNAAL
jgi:hypothetical protein